MTEPTRRFRASDTTLVLFGIILVAAVLAWLVPPGEFASIKIEGGRDV